MERARTLAAALEQRLRSLQDAVPAHPGLLHQLGAAQHVDPLDVVGTSSVEPLKSLLPTLSPAILERSSSDAMFSRSSTDALQARLHGAWPFKDQLLAYGVGAEEHVERCDEHTHLLMSVSEEDCASLAELQAGNRRLAVDGREIIELSRGLQYELGQALRLLGPHAQPGIPRWLRMPE